MMVGRFVARCQRGHELIEFTEAAPFERHMRQVHKARKPSYGMPDAPRPGGLPNKYLRPSRVPTTTEGLTRVLNDATATGRNGWTVRGSFVGVCDDWHTDERVEPAALRAGDVFEFGRQSYTVVEVHPDTWTISAEMNGTTRTHTLDERNAAKLRNAERITILKRAA
jgi:hypothetical protein